MAGEGWSGRVRSEFLHRLASFDGDWLAACRTVGPLDGDAEVMARDFATESLRQFWRRMQSEPRRPERGPKSEAQHMAEEAA
jgi:hypothetical protein